MPYFHSGIFTLVTKQVKTEEFKEFERAWYSQASSAIMSRDGNRTECSDAVDATGRYIWREDGAKDGRCCGIDFEQAGEKWRAKECSNADAVCSSAAISTYVPFAYDAAIALARGLDQLVHLEGLSPNNVTADRLIRTIQNSNFEGLTGHVSFLDNGDREVDSFEYVVYNYQNSARGFGFKPVGEMANGHFAPICEDGPCASMIFSDGTSQIPASAVRKM